MESINIKISPEGEIQYEVKGVKGAKCKTLTKFIDQLSGAVLETRVTGEYCQVETGQQQKLGGAS